jgi:peptide deformylase
MSDNDSVIEEVPFDFDFVPEELQVLPIHHEMLSTRPGDFDFEKHGTENAEKLAVGLLAKMLSLNTIFLSAPQVGIPFRVFVYGRDEYMKVMFNPQLTGISVREWEYKEGCASFPGLNLKIRRHRDIQVMYQDETGTEKIESHTAVEARIIQHEMDHMEGISYTTHVSPHRLRQELNKLNARMINIQQRNAAYARLEANSARP